MRIEHFALNVEDPLALSRWYVEHLGLRVVRRAMESPWAHFLTDDGGQIMVEVYGNPDVPLPDYHQQNPMVMHLAYVTQDVEADVARLTAAGATQIGDLLHTPAGDVLAMLRDPWGVPIQLAKRASPML